jgi:outer membrane protein OmpA-like peptidoglycan-associated protein
MAIINAALACLKTTVDGYVSAAGHAAPRGTAEYNIALSDRRARAVRDHLKRLGVDATRVAVLPRGSLDASGEDERGWARGRRVDLLWR